METGRGATGSKRRKIRDLVERLRRSEESKRLEAEKLARVAVCVDIKILRRVRAESTAEPTAKPSIKPTAAHYFPPSRPFG